ncbi:MAG: hypothetical protein IIA63_06210 [Nitrospinae bacterium]|nr:hypothetical protein [Nitrospinota bacterium]MCH7650738.1 hypothetical protein [Nitrospinota bacterium]MCH8933939.1 hypothetical protein [Nitrospinota bacterium]
MENEFLKTLNKAERWMDEIEGVHGVAQGEIDGRDCITVFVSHPEVAKKIPNELDGYPVVTEESEGFGVQG